MAARKPPPKPTPTNVRFVNIELDKRQQQEVKAQPWSLDAFENAMLNAFEAGYKLSIRRDERNKCYAAWLIPPEQGHENSGYILAGRGSTPSKAVKQLIYIHDAVLEGVWGVDQGYDRSLIDD